MIYGKKDCNKLGQRSDWPGVCPAVVNRLGKNIKPGHLEVRLLLGILAISPETRLVIY